MELAEIVTIVSAGYPPSVAFVPPLVLFVLALTAFVDARTGRVPDAPLAVAFVGAFAALAYWNGWLVALDYLWPALAFVLVLYFSNRIFVKLFRHDAFGMGDVKWTGAATIAYGAEAVIGAWVVGAVLGLVWMGARRLWLKVSDSYEGHAYVHFVPFLFLGLLVSLFSGWSLY